MIPLSRWGRGYTPVGNLCQLDPDGTSLQVLNPLLQRPRDFRRVGFRRELDWLANADLNFSWRSMLFPRLLDCKQTIDPHRKHGDSQIVGEQAYSSAKGLDLAVGGVLALRKNQDAVAAVNRPSSISKALAETGLAWQREQVEQRNRERPLHPIVDSSKPPAFGAG